MKILSENQFSGKTYFYTIASSKSIKINVRGTKEMMELAREMEGLESFVHVSTAYAHCHLMNEVIQEKGKGVGQTSLF